MKLIKFAKFLGVVTLAAGLATGCSSTSSTDTMAKGNDQGVQKIISEAKAELAKAEYNRALHYLSPVTQGWYPRAYTCSALTGAGIPEIWAVIKKFRQQMTVSGTFATRRRAQALDWVYAMVEEHLRTLFYDHPQVKDNLPQIEAAVVDGRMPATAAVKALLQAFELPRD